MKKKQKKIRVLLFVPLVTVLMLFIMLSICTIGYYVASRFSMLRITKEDLRDDSGLAASIVTDYASYQWLLRYWDEHAAEMDVPRGALSEKDGEWWEDHQWLQLVNTEAVSEEDVMALSEKEQLSFAEYCYLEVAEDFDYLAQQMKNTEYVCIVLRRQEDGFNAFVLFRGMTGEENGEYPLGEQEEIEKKQEEFFLGDADAFSSRFIASRDMYGDATLYVPVLLSEDEEMRFLVIGSCSTHAVNEVLRESIRFIGTYQLVVAVIGSTCIFALIIFGVSRPIRHVQATVNRYARSKDIADVTRGFAKMVKRRRLTEVDCLASDILDMAMDIDCYAEETLESAHERERRSVEMEMAVNIQKSVLPVDFPMAEREKRFDIFAVMYPAREVGGDFYDFFFIDKDHLALVIADVSDKGVPAAFFMMQAKTLLRSIAVPGKRPSAIMEELNEKMMEHNETEQFMTTWLMVIDLSTGIADEVNAGHTKPAFCRGERPYKLVSNSHSLSIGMGTELPFQENRWILQPGDKLFVYTDGVTEAENAGKEQFGKDRMLSALTGVRLQSQQEILSRLKESVAAFAGEIAQTDDLTMLGFTFWGNEPTKTLEP